MATMLRAGGEMTIGGVFSRAFAAIRAAPATFFGTGFVLVALPSVLIGRVTRAAMLGGANLRDWSQMLPALIGSIVAWWLLYMAAQAVLFRATVAAVDGRPERFGAHAGAAARSLVPLVALSIVLSVAVWVGMLCFIVPGVMLAIIWSVAAPVLVIERVGVFAALGRSQRLSRGARWRILGLVVVVFMAYFVAASTLGIGDIAANGTAAAVRPTPPLIATIFSVALQTGFVAVWTAVQAALYTELRDWKDGPAGDRLADIFA